jgi:hypothetical protein
MSVWSVLKNIAKVGTAFIPGAGPFISAGLTAADANGWMGGGKSGSGAFDPNSPEGLAEAQGGADGGIGGFLSKLLGSPLTMGTLGPMAYQSIFPGDSNRSKAMRTLEEKLLSAKVEEALGRAKATAPLREGAFSALGGMLKPGSGSLISPEGVSPVKLPARNAFQPNDGLWRRGYSLPPSRSLVLGR